MPRTLAVLFVLAGPQACCAQTQAQTQSEFSAGIREAQPVKSAERRAILLLRAIPKWRPADGQESLARAYNDLAATCLVLGKSAEASNYSEKAVALAPRSGPFYITRFAANIARNRYQRAFVDLSTAERLQLGPQGPYVISNNRCALFQLWRDYGRAIRNCEEAARQRPDDIGTLVNLGMAQADSGKTEEAWQTLKKASKNIQRLLDQPITAQKTRDQASGILHRARGSAHHSSKEYEKALEEFGKALEKERGSPGEVMAYCKRALTLAALGRTKDAFADLDRALEAWPTSVEALTDRAALNAKAGRRKSAREDLDKAIKITPFPDALFQRGTLLMEDKRWKEAAADLEAAAQNKSVFPQAWAALGKARKALGDPAAKDAFEQACRQDPGLCPK